MFPFCWGGKNYGRVSPFDWRHLNLPVRGYPMCGYCLSCEDVDHEAAQIAASAAQLAASATLLPRQLLLFFVLVLLQLGWMPWTAWSDGDVAVRTHRLATWSGSLDPKFKDVQSFHINFWWCFTTGFTQGFFIGAGMSRGVDQGEEWWTPCAMPIMYFSGDSLAEIAKHHSTWRGKESHPNLGFTWGNYMVIPPSASTHLQMHVAICASGSIEGGSAKPW